jgi:hypothetical protein
VPVASAASTPDGPAGTVTVVNDGNADRYVTVAVERGDETVFVDSRTVRGGTSRVLERVVPESGSYRVVVETADGVRGRFDWAVTEALGDLRVRVGEEVTFSQVLRCDPDCRGVSLGGSATGYPDGGFDPRGRRVGSTLRVRNDATAARSVRLSVADGAVLDYRYRVPPTTTLEVPVPQRSGKTRVDIERTDGGGSETYQWSMESSPVLDVWVGSTVRVTCGERDRDLRLLNEADDVRRLDVVVSTEEGTDVFTAKYDLAPGEVVREDDVVSTAGDYELTVSTGESSFGFEWSTCPARGPVYVIVRADGTVEMAAVAPI